MSTRPGVSRIELVIAIAVPVILLGLIALGIDRVRTQALHVQTSNNLKQCSLGVHNFHDTYRRLPDAFAPGGIYSDSPRSLWFHLLPYVDPDCVYKGPMTNEVIQAYLAPLDPFVGDPHGKLSFAANLRLFAFDHFAEMPSAKNPGEPLPLPDEFATLKANILLPKVEATSNTIMFTTRYAECAGTTTRYAANPAAFGGFFGLGRHTQLPSSIGNNLDIAWQIAPSNDPASPSICNPAPGVFGHSFRRGEIHLAMVDASVRVINPGESQVFAKMINPYPMFER